VQFLDVPHQRFLTRAVHFHRAPFPLARPNAAVAWVAWKQNNKKSDNGDQRK